MHGAERSMAADCATVWRHVVPTFAKSGFDPKTADRATGFATFTFREGQQLFHLTQQINAYTNAGARALSGYQRFGIENATFTASDDGASCRTSAVFDFVGYKYNLLFKGWFKLPTNGVLEARILNEIAEQASHDAGSVELMPVHPVSQQEAPQRVQKAELIDKPQTETPHVKFTSDPTGAEVTIDGEYIGSTPTTQIDLKEGSHVIRIRRRGFIPWERTLSLKLGDARTVSAELDSEPIDPKKPRIVGLE